MTGDNFEYAIKKDVRNNPIVREVDRERHRDLWRTAITGVFLVTVLVFTVWRLMVLMTHGYSSEALREQIAKTEAENEAMQLEIESLEAPSRIEPMAKRDLGMIEPPLQDQLVIPRMVPSPPPSRSVVALR